jgi:hypothetical protein
MNRKSRTTFINGLPRKNSVAKLMRPKATTKRSKKKIIAPILDFMSVTPSGRVATILSITGRESARRGRRQAAAALGLDA